MNEEASKSKRVLGRDEPGIFDHDVVTSGSFKAHGGGLNKLAGPLTMQKWLGFAIVSADPSSVDAWGLREAGRAWFNSTDELFKFWDGTQILLLAPLQSVTSMLCFADNFSDASIHWAWRLFLGEVSETGKSGTEASGQYQLAVTSGYDGKWDTSNNEAPRLFVSPLCAPCEIITRLDNVGTISDNTFAGLFISKRPAGFGSNLSYAIGRKRDDGESINGICVVENTYSNLATTAVTDLPVWLRLRIGCVAYGSLNVWFDYSVDGVSWTNLYRQGSGVTVFSIPSVGVGLYVANGADANDSASKNEIVGKFDSFTVSMARGPG